MATVIVDESFNGAISNTNLESFTTNNNWNRVSGAANGWVVQTSGLLRCNPQTGDGYISDNTSNQGGFIEFTLASPFIADADVFAAIRVQDANNYYGINVAGTGSAGLRLNSVIGGTENDTLFQGQAVNGETYRIEDDGTELRLYSGSLNGEGGTLLHTETTTTLATATGKGFVNRGGSSSTSPQFDQYKSGTLGAPPAGTIDTDNDETQKVWSRNASNEAQVTITGTYSGTPTALERSINGGAFATFDAAPSGNTWTDTFILSSGEYSLAYRFTNDTGISTTLSTVVVGEVIVPPGQSGSSGRFTNNQTYSPSAGGLGAWLFGNDDVSKALTDPYDSDVNQVDPVSADVDAAGSWLPRFANAWLAENEVPLIIVPVAKGGSAIADWSRDTSAATLYGSMLRRVNAVGGCNTVFWQQGERDSRSDVNTPLATYRDALIQFAADVQSDFSADTYVIALHTIDPVTYSNQATIRQAQLDAAAASPNIEISQSMTDLDAVANGDGVHLKTDADANTVGLRAFENFFTVTSSLTINIGAPDGSYRTVLVDDSNTVVYSDTLTYASGSASVSGLNVPVNTNLEGFVTDNETPHVNGAVITGTTS